MKKGINNTPLDTDNIVEEFEKRMENDITQTYKKITVLDKLTNFNKFIMLVILIPIATLLPLFNLTLWLCHLVFISCFLFWWALSIRWYNHKLIHLGCLYFLKDLEVVNGTIVAGKTLPKKDLKFKGPEWAK